MALWCGRLTARVKALVLVSGGGRTPSQTARAAIAGALLLAVAIGTAEASDQNKSQYTLFNPTPDRLLRDLTTDRPDTTESPFTVDAGRIQVETNLFGYTRSRPDVDGTVTDSYDFLITNVRIGLTHTSEVNVVFQPYGIVRTRPLDPLLATRSSGVGGVDIRGKFNLWGNDSFDKPGATAFALLPFITLPTDRNNGISPDGVEGGLILPFAVKLSEKFGLGLNAGVHVVRNERHARASRGVSRVRLAVVRMDRSGQHLLRGGGALQHRQSARRRRRAGDRLHLQAEQEPAIRRRDAVRRDQRRRPVQPVRRRVGAVLGLPAPNHCSLRMVCRAHISSRYEEDSH